MSNLKPYNSPDPQPPPSYEQCVAPMLHPIPPRSADYTATPLAMAALFAWDEDED